MSTYWVLFTLSSPIEDLEIMEITEPPETTEMSEFFDEIVEEITCIRRKNEGQCDSNPTYMLQQCPEECGSTNRYYCNHDDNGGKCQKSTGRCKSDYDCSFHHHNERIMCSKLSNDDEYGWCKSTCKISINVSTFFFSFHSFLYCMYQYKNLTCTCNYLG